MNLNGCRLKAPEGASRSSSDVLSVCLKKDTGMWKMYVKMEIFDIFSDLTSLELKFGCRYTRNMAYCALRTNL